MMKYLKAFGYGLLLGIPVASILLYYKGIDKRDVRGRVGTAEFAKHNIYQTNPREVINAILDIREDVNIKDWHECKETIRVTAIITQILFIAALLVI